ERAACVLDMACDQAPHERDVFGFDKRLEIDHFRVATSLELARSIEHVRNAPAHAGRKVPTSSSEDDHTATRHVLTPVVADPLDNRQGAAVSDGKPLAGDASEVRFAASRAVERDVAEQYVAFRDEPCRLR